MAGAKMVTSYPVSICTHGLALNITVQSYNGALDFGLIACRRAMPDIAEFGKLVAEEHRSLLAAAAALVPQAKVETPVVAPVAAVKPPRNRALGSARASTRTALPQPLAIKATANPKKPAPRKRATGS